MNGDGQISRSQMGIVVGQLCWATALIYLPPHLIRTAGPDSWLSLLIGSLAGVISLSIAASLAQRWPGADLCDQAERALGPWIGRLLTASYTFYFLIITARDLRYVADIFVGMILSQTPIVVIMGVIAILAAWLARAGAVVLCRVNSLSFGFGMFILLFVPFMLAGKLEFRNLAPFLGAGWGPVLRGAYSAAGWFVETIAVASFLPYSEAPGKQRGSWLAGLAFGTLGMEILLVTSLLLFGPSLGGYLVKPSDTLMTMISIGQFVERIDVLLVGIWQPAVTLRIALTFYAAVTGMKRLAGLRDYSPIALALATTAVTIGLWAWPMAQESIYFGNIVWPAYSLVMGFGGLLLVAVVAMLRGE